jgi:hypothetical protein
MVRSAATSLRESHRLSPSPDELPDLAAGLLRGGCGVADLAEPCRILPSWVVDLLYYQRRGQGQVIAL